MFIGMRRVSRPGRLILATVTIGVLVGIGATGFHLVADRFGDILFAWVESQTAASRLPFVLILPTVGLGLVGSLVGRRCRLTRNSLRTLVRAGAAAGISAAFRSPAGGVLMALEVFGARFNRDLTAISAAAGIAFLTRTAVLGDAYPFSLP